MLNVLVMAADVLGWMAGNSTEKLEVIAQYWQLVAQPGDPRSGDFGYSEADMRRFGAGEGLRVYKALEEAADRHVHIRCSVFMLFCDSHQFPRFIVFYQVTAKKKKIVLCYCHLL